jgi:hypothetical protein
MNVFVTLQADDRELFNELANRNEQANELRDSLDQDKWVSDFPETFEMDVYRADIMITLLGLLKRTSFEKMLKMVA